MDPQLIKLLPDSLLKTIWLDYLEMEKNKSKFKEFAGVKIPISNESYLVNYYCITRHLPHAKEFFLQIKKNYIDDERFTKREISKHLYYDLAGLFTLTPKPVDDKLPIYRTDNRQFQTTMNILKRLIKKKKCLK
ncbi:hypothetical protein RFI_23941 [Reticulomyxa filosa]|uniref:Uncharacterized protein n=1 Tax=Reticulomyxa filosa TaxID=46433 RepID=X6MHV4_RETFI|nr:hypothetical protein RFI_23941 [Reticulomyxa filosa]|eukprot:ETO13434.1 hypothetical protein RFI_23941 [Reticulomyxa filosa]